MKVILLAYSQGKASGGHYHSLDQLSREIAKAVSVKVVTFGTVLSPVLKDNPYFKKHISFSGKRDLVALNNALGKEIKEEQATVLHCFDTESMNWILLSPSTRKLPVVLNKCGGPNPIRQNWQHADAIILFSKENQDWFRSKPQYKNADLYLIPNRVRQLHFLAEEHRKEEKDKEKVNFVRISRLGGAYEKTLWDTLRMIEVLREEYPVHLYVIGRIQDPVRFSLFEKAILEKELPVTIITDERASRGADFLYLADFVIGTGRSLMEALSLGLPTLTPAQNMEWPVLVHQDNFDTLFRTNFSERNEADPDSLNENAKRITGLISNPLDYQQAQEEARLLFERYFSLDGVGGKYHRVYEQVLTTRHSRLSLIFKNFMYLTKLLLLR